MHPCRDPEHPHCTVWVMPGERVCAHGHPQPAQASAPGRPQLHVSGFDPRAAGGRHAIKLELRGMPADCPAGLSLALRSTLPLHCAARHLLARGSHGEWCPAFIEFSSRGLEHGQHRIEVELDGAGRKWICSVVVLVPRADASLADIHAAFLANHKNVRVFADDGSIARVNAAAASGSVDIDVSARNAGIARLELEATGPANISLGLPTIAWDEDLVEVDGPLIHAAHPYPADAACLRRGACHERLFAGEQLVIGRYDAAPSAQLLLAHPDSDGLTRRISGRHAVIRHAPDGYTIEDVSRYGILVDGEWPGKHRPVALRQGMRIELTASVPGIATLEVCKILHNALVLERVDGVAERFWLLAPEREPLAQGTLPLLFHHAGGFWLREASSGADVALEPDGKLPGLPLGTCFAGGPYPETWNVRARTPDRRRAGPMLPAM